MVYGSTPAFLSDCEFCSLLLTDLRVPSFNILAEEMALVGFVGCAVDT